MYCEFYTQDWMVVMSALAFVLGTVSTIACIHFQDNSVEKTVTKHEYDIQNLSLKLDKVHSQYERDMMTILRETLRPSSQRSIVSDVTDVREDEPAMMDNNSIPAGPSGPI